MANCETCKKVQSAPENVPYIVHEATMEQAGRKSQNVKSEVSAIAE